MECEVHACLNNNKKIHAQIIASGVTQVGTELARKMTTKARWYVLGPQPGHECFKGHMVIVVEKVPYVNTFKIPWGTQKNTRQLRRTLCDCIIRIELQDDIAH
jgi:hypothetical protein